jgi:hypothetical protein
MKVDKDTLVKQRFWVGLGAFALLWLIVLLVALFSSGDKAVANAAKVKAQKDQINGAKDIKNENYTIPVTQKKEELQGKKNVVWKDAWKGQETMMFWPQPKDHSEVWDRLAQQGHFGDEIAGGDRTDYRNVYGSQLPIDGDTGIKALLKPIQARGGDWNTLIRRATFDQHITPTNEEVWLAQEDLWVQWELLSIVKAAEDSAALFENVANFKRAEMPKEPPKPADTAAAAPAPDDAKKPVVLKQRFRNPHWQLDLVMELKDKELTVTPQTTLKSLHGGAPQPVAGLDLQLGQWAAKPPKAQHLVFEGKPDDKGLLALAKPVALPDFDPEIEDVPLAVTVAADKSDPPPTQKGTLRYRMRNENWELELLLEQAPDGQHFVSPKSKVTNISATRRTLPIGQARFAIWQKGRYLADVTVNDEWLAAGSTTTTNKTATFVVPDEKSPVDVYEMFSWDNSPIKRVDAIEFPGGTSFNSHRTANLMLKPAAQFPIEKPPETTTPASGGAGGGMSGMMGGGKMGELGLAGTSNTDKTPNGLVRNRYIAVTEQVRHMPVALELVVDQAHMQDVLTAVVNSRLRIQITQVQWKRIRGVKSGGEDTFAGGGGIPGGMGPPGGMMGMGGRGGYGPGMGGRGPGSYGPSGYGSGRGGPSPLVESGGTMGPGSPPSGRGNSGSGLSPRPGTGGAGPLSPPGSGAGPGPRSPGAASAAADEGDPNLVELAVYGIAALYERFPPKPKADATTAAAGATGAAAPAQPAK